MERTPSERPTLTDPENTPSGGILQVGEEWKQDSVVLILAMAWFWIAADLSNPNLMEVTGKVKQFSGITDAVGEPISEMVLPMWGSCCRG